MRNLFLGANNIFGHYALESGFNCLSHLDFDPTRLSKYNRLILSAFSPRNLSGVTDDEILHKILNSGFRGTLVYVSTMRIGDSDEKYSIYAAAKLRQEEILAKNFSGDLVIKRFPVVLSKKDYGRKGFLKMLRDGLHNGSVVFDVGLESSWRFVFIEDVFPRLFESQNENVTSQHEISVRDLAEELSLICDVTLRGRSKTSRYPDESLYPDFFVDLHCSKETLIKRIVNAVTA